LHGNYAITISLLWILAKPIKRNQIWCVKTSKRQNVKKKNNNNNNKKTKKQKNKKTKKQKNKKTKKQKNKKTKTKNKKQKSKQKLVEILDRYFKLRQVTFFQCRNVGFAIDASDSHNLIISIEVFQQAGKSI